MVSWKLLLVLLVVCLLLEELDAQRNRPSAANRNRNRNRGNRNRNRGNNPRQRQGGNRVRGGGRGGGARGGSGNRCEVIQVPMCKGLVGYTRTKLPNRFNHTTQLQVYRVLEHMWAQIDRGCSQNLRLLACSLYLPKCAGRRRPGREPCAKVCDATKRRCESRLEEFGSSWPSQINCSSLPRRACVKGGKHYTCTATYTQCENIELPMCPRAVTGEFSRGMSPNMFGQCNRTEVATEMEQYRPLVDSACSPHLNLFLCGVFSPFCTSVEGVMAFPCRELCERVQGACHQRYARLSGGLPWPNKFQCHRYPPVSDRNYTCLAVGEGAGGGYRLNTEIEEA